MNRKEFIEAISASAKVPPKAVNAVASAIMAHLQAELAKGEPAKLPGFGTFIKKPPAQEGKPSRIIFRPTAIGEGQKLRQQRAGGDPRKP